MRPRARSHSASNGTFNPFDRNCNAGSNAGANGAPLEERHSGVQTKGTTAMAKEAILLGCIVMMQMLLLQQLILI
jgi:hypothetical protein